MATERVFASLLFLLLLWLFRYRLDIDMFGHVLSIHVSHMESRRRPSAKSCMCVIHMYPPTQWGNQTCENAQSTTNHHALEYVSRFCL